MEDEDTEVDSLSSQEPCIACADCGDVVPVRRAYFTGVDGRQIHNAVCYKCHEDAVRRATRQTDERIKK